MKRNILASDKFRQPVGRRSACFLLLVAGSLLLPGCGIFNSSFLGLVDPEGTGLGSTADLPPGFVVITFANNAKIDEQLLSFLERSAEGGLVLTDEQKIALRPRVRLTVRITFAERDNNGNAQFLDVEFISGSADLVEPRFLAESAPDLNQNALDNVLAVCEIQSVALRPGSPIEVFIPVELTELQLLETAGPGGETLAEFQPRASITPRFRALQTDQVDANGGTIRQNIGIEDLPSPIQNPLCGSVIGITLDGTLSVPFHQSRDTPSYDGDDPIAVGTIGGRFEFRVTIG